MGILLISLGIIMLVSQIRGISVLNHIIQWWPMVLVILGIEILAQVVLSKKEEPMIKYDAFSIFIVIVLILFSVGAYTVTNVLGGIQGVSVPLGIHLGKYETTVQKNFAINASGKEMVRVDNRQGNVSIDRGSGDNVEVEAAIVIRNNDEEYARLISDSIIEISEDGEIKISTKDSGVLGMDSKIQDIRVNYSIKVPENMSLKVTNRFGGVNLQNIGQSAQIENKNGKITAKMIGKDLTVENAFGAIDIADVGGDANITNSNGRIDVKKIGGSVSINGKYGEINSSDIKGNLNAEGNNGGMSFKNVAGDVKLSNKFGRISLENANKTVEIKGSNGSITFNTDEVVQNNVRIENQFGAVSLGLLQEQQGHFKAETEFGNISSQFGFKIEKDTTHKSMDQRIGENGPEFNLSVQNGNINIENN